MADSVTAPATTDQTQPESPRRDNRRGNPRGSGRSRGQRQRQPQIQPPNGTAAGRAFGGQLTRLDAQANSFIPASVLPAGTSKKSAPSSAQNSPATSAPTTPRRARRFSRSTAPDLATRVHEDIAHSLYECAICSNEISRNSKTWACHTCWTVFHIGCIKKWSKNEGSAVQQRNTPMDGSETPVGKQWRCPGCNLAKDVLPSSYTCWCEKEVDPKIITGLPPHSCGQTCGRDRKFPKVCPHPCDQICHAGPCPPCTSIGPQQSCFCGKQSTTRRCVDTEYEAGWSCGEICGDMMPCGEHSCTRPCHEGLCGACTTRVDVKCYCGKAEQTMMCNEQDEEKESYGWTGVFNCRQVCGRSMDCGTHICEKICHPQDEDTPHCPRSPDVVLHCHCGKTPLADLQNEPRTACTDPIPSCKQPCGKSLACGHPCPQICHVGDCAPCFAKIPITCRCGRNKFDSMCYSGEVEAPQCFRVCKATLNCGRHECGERCCTGEKKAAERQATKRRLKPLGAARIVDEGIEAEHICTRVCNRPLKCGNHNCQELCHKGPCGTCREAIFDDISCNCGRTVLTAPLPCGTRPPPCTYPCKRPKNCGHPQVQHNCHTDEEECPKCPFLTEKRCLCNKMTLKNQPCWRADVLCGLVCGKTLKCGSHKCRKTCHKPGDCEDGHSHCQQECGKPKKTCGHPCEQPCHAPSACKEEKPCPFKIMITCDCQRKKEEVRCNARAHVPEPPGRQNSLKCDDECARLERNRKLAGALHISDDHTDDHVPYSTDTLRYYIHDVSWAHKQEDILRIFAADDEEKRYRFPPMKRRQRSFIHSIAADFGFDGESLDPEPHRHVIIFKTPKFVAAPMKTLAQAARIRRAQLNIQAPITASSTEKRADEALKQDFNGLLLRNPRFALTEDELLSIVAPSSPYQFRIIFLSSSDAVALLLKDGPADPSETTKVLGNLYTNLSAAIRNAKLASSVVLCTFDLSPSLAEPKILQQADYLPTSTGSAQISTGGWSQVAAKRSAAPRSVVPEPAIGQRPVYTVLGSRLAEAKKEKEKKKAEEAKMKKIRKEMEQEDVVDDWTLGVEDDDDFGDSREHSGDDFVMAETGSGSASDAEIVATQTDEQVAEQQTS